MIDRHKFAIKTNDEQNWLADNINLLTEEEYKSMLEIATPLRHILR